MTSERESKHTRKKVVNHAKKKLSTFNYRTGIKKSLNRHFDNELVNKRSLFLKTIQNKQTVTNRNAKSYDVIFKSAHAELFF